MQIAGNWRLRAQRYRLQGFRQRDGKLDLQRRQQIAIPDYQATASDVPQHQVVATK